MISLGFSVLGARAEPYAAVPTLGFKLEVTETSGEQIHVLALRCQLQIEPRRRRYSPHEEKQLLELFGGPERWGNTLRTIVWTHVSVLVPGFSGRTEVDLPVPCTYDFEVTASKYFHALQDGEILLRFLFSGTVFARGESGFNVHQVPWDKEATYRLPVRVWRDLMDLYFPGSAWIRLRRDSFDALHQFKGQHALPTWDDAIEALLEKAGEKAEVSEPTGGGGTA
ncbi:MAG: DUF6084 family protein [Gemmatimonadaceae bacterium]